MARDDVLRAVWRDKRFRALPASARALFAQMVVLGPTSSAGVLPLMPAKWAAGSPDTDEASTRADLAKLAEVGFVVVDAQTFEVLIRNFIHLSGAHRIPNHLRGALNSAKAVDSPMLRQCLALELGKVDGSEVVEAIEILVADMDLGSIDDASAEHEAVVHEPSEEDR
ncbi:hypothetical protein [Nocardia sp. NBC_00511]|uniref:hypothetical protein n=1 Tax=Nocardia sp. NBC_00511 TaxID=2903591 RepID=UPI0030DE5C61